MNRIWCNRYGDLLFRQAESGEVPAGHVRLRIECALAIPGEKFPLLKQRVLGRYFFARVEETAPDVTSVFEDDAVTVLPVVACGACEACASGHPERCENPEILGETLDGAWQDEMTVPERFLQILPYDIEPVQGALFAPLAQVIEGLLRYPRAYGRSLGVAGCELHGCLALQAGRALGFSPICAIDVSEAYRRRAVKHGADFTLNPSNDQAHIRLRNLTDGGLDMILDTGENEGTEELTLSGLRKGAMAVFMDAGERKIDLSEEALRMSGEAGQIRIEYPMFTHPVSEDALRAALWMIKTRSISTEGLIDRTITLSALPGAWEDGKMGLVRGVIVIAPQMEQE